MRTPAVICTGDYSTWADALSASTGFYLPEFVEKTRQAALKVKRGQAVYERDSVLFDEIQLSFPVLAALLRAAAEYRNELVVFDFGGGFGTSYFQCRQFLKPVRSLRWLVVDQPAHVEYGQRDFQSDELQFFEDDSALLAQYRPTVLLLSGVLPCVEAPYDLFGRLLGYGIPYVIVDRTFFLSRGVDRLTVQHGPSGIYDGSYPAWFLSEARLVRGALASGYELVAAFDGFDDVGPDDESAYTKGFIWRYREGGKSIPSPS